MSEAESNKDMQKDTRVIVVANHKGGAGKTTTTVNLAAEFGRAGLDVLVIDLDAQANASLHIGLEHPSEIKVSCAELLVSDDPLLPLAVHGKTTLEGVSLIYGGLKLDRAEMELQTNSPRPNEELAHKIEPLMGVFDIILIDCPPSLRLLTSNALACATDVIIPIESGSQYGLYGVSDLVGHMNKIRRINRRMNTLGALLLRHDERQKLCRLIRGLAQKEIGAVLPIEISSSNKFNRAAVDRVGIHTVDRTSKVAREFRELAYYLMGQFGIAHEVTQDSKCSEKCADHEGGEADVDA